MMDRIMYGEENDVVRERFNLAMERIRLMDQEKTVQEPFNDYFQRVSVFMLQIGALADLVENGRLRKMNLKELQALNNSLYEDIVGEHYQSSYANPSYACRLLGMKYGRLLSFLYTELRSCIVFAYEKRMYELTIFMELLIEIYNCFEQEDSFTYKDKKRAIYDFMSDYCDVFVTYRTREMLDPDSVFAKDIIMGSDLSDLRYLYWFGEYITDNELLIAKYLTKLSDERIQAMADTFTEGFRLGFVNNRRDLNKKTIVNIRYQIGFERMVRAAVKNFEKLGLKTTIYRAAVNAINKRQHLKIGYHATSPNKQYDYDHRFDIGLFFDKAFKERKLECLKNSMEQYKENAGNFAGPALIEVFGEELFSPEDRKEAVKLDKRQQKLYVDYNNRANLINKEYLKAEESSFTIISYPIPEISKDFDAIFNETVKVNTLDSGLYRRIQQSIIDELDKGEYVRIKGAGRNHTDLKIMLHPLEDKSRETNFENCIADVNIPVGEVFTSPLLKGTKGVLHVPRIYLNDLEYRELELTFEDGRIKDYSCSNFTDDIKNKGYIKENLFYNHESLPIGEFAIGTNTTAYMMGKRYDIAPRLPILIAEKTGPHFAIGDTCYKMSEEVKVYNPDGKEIVARDNEVSILRKSDPKKAYYNCHTDITLPYDEIEEIAVYTKEGTSIPIIRKGRFVPEGALLLNEAFDR